MNESTRSDRLSRRKLKIWSEDYLVYKFLWPHLAEAISASRAIIAKDHPRVLDVGCGNKPYLDLFGGAEYVGLNYSREHANPDVLGDAMHLPFADSAFDIVFSTQVLEHLPEPAAFLSEAFRVLTSGGVLIVSCPFYWPLHEEPYDFYRYTKYGLVHMLAKAQFTEPVVLADGGGWAQAFLAIGLQLPSRLRALRVATNLLGLLLDKHFGNAGSTANYTAWARKPR